MAAPGRKKGPAPRPARTQRSRPRTPPSAPRAAAQAPASAPPPRNGLGTTALGLGVVAVIASPTLTFGVLLGVPALVVGFLARKRVSRGEATNKRSTTAAMLLGAVAVAIVIGLIVYGRILLNTPAGKRYTACVDRAGDDRAAAQVCEDVFDRER